LIGPEGHEGVIGRGNPALTRGRTSRPPLVQLQVRAGVVSEPFLTSRPDPRRAPSWIGAPDDASYIVITMRRRVPEATSAPPRLLNRDGSARGQRRDGLTGACVAMPRARGHVGPSWTTAFVAGPPRIGTPRSWARRERITAFGFRMRKPSSRDARSAGPERTRAEGHHRATVACVGVVRFGDTHSMPGCYTRRNPGIEIGQLRVNTLLP
jgi:hypothetical protein